MISQEINMNRNNKPLHQLHKLQHQQQERQKQAWVWQEKKQREQQEQRRITDGYFRIGFRQDVAPFTDLEIKNQLPMAFNSQWMIQAISLSDEIRVQTGQRCHLTTLVADRFMSFNRFNNLRNKGDDLILGDRREKAHILFQRESNSGKPVKYGELIAIRIEVPGDFVYLCHKNAMLGNNLSYSSEPEFEWQILGGKVGKSVKFARPVCIFNSVAADYLVYGKQFLRSSI
jgi:hypothetical protein